MDMEWKRDRFVHPPPGHVYVCVCVCVCGMYYIQYIILYIYIQHENIRVEIHHRCGRVDTMYIPYMWSVYILYYVWSNTATTQSD